MSENNDTPQEEEITQEILSDEETAIIGENKVSKKGHAFATEMVEKARIMVNAADEQSKSCKNLLDEGLTAYANAKKELGDGGLDECVELLGTLGHNIQDGESHEDELVFETGMELESIEIEEIKSGGFSSLLLALLVGLATFIGLIYLATEKRGVTLDITSMPTSEMTDKLLSWFANFLGSDSVYLGAALLAVITLLMMLVTYLIRSSFKAKKNLFIAENELKKAESYIEKKYDCKLEMEKVDTHMKDAIDMLKTYEVLLNEQKGKLQRIYHVEGEKESGEEYHAKSFLEIRETKEMIQQLREFLAISMSSEGKLSGKSTLFLHRTKNNLDKAIRRRY